MGKRGSTMRGQTDINYVHVSCLCDEATCFQTLIPGLLTR